MRSQWARCDFLQSPTNEVEKVADPVIFEGMDFATKLHRLIGKSDLNQSKLARAIGVSPATINEMVNYGKRPYLDQAFPIARKLGVSLEYLADDSLDEPPLPLTKEELHIIDAVRSSGVTFREVIDWLNSRKKGVHGKEPSEVDPPVKLPRKSG